MKTLLTLLLYISLSSTALAGNSVFIEQIGTSTDTTIAVDIDGNNNSVNLTMEGTNNDLNIKQEGNNNIVSWISYWGSGKAWGGDLDGNSNTIKTEQYNTTGTDANRVGMHIQSNSNTVSVGQGCTYDSQSDTTCSGSVSEYGGHTTNLDLHSGNNNIKVGQSSGSVDADHYAQIYMYGGEYNTMFVKQDGSGNKTLNMTVRTDGGTQSVIQKDSGAHVATIDLTGSYHTDLNLIQQGSTNQSYSLTQNCLTSGGCSVGITQGN